MSAMFKTTLRIKTDTPEGRKALGYLKSRDKTRYHSYSDAIIAAVNGYFDRERQLADDPYLETREKEDAFLQRILETVERGAQVNPALRNQWYLLTSGRVNLDQHPYSNSFSPFMSEVHLIVHPVD